MKAKQIPRIDIHDRIELKNALPLRTPYVIYSVEVSISTYFALFGVKNQPYIAVCVVLNGYICRY